MADEEIIPDFSGSLNISNLISVKIDSLNIITAREQHALLVTALLDLKKNLIMINDIEKNNDFNIDINNVNDINQFKKFFDKHKDIIQQWMKKYNAETSVEDIGFSFERLQQLQDLTSTLILQKYGTGSSKQPTDYNSDHDSLEQSDHSDKTSNTNYSSSYGSLGYATSEESDASEQTNIRPDSRAQTNTTQQQIPRSTRMDQIANEFAELTAKQLNNKKTIQRTSSKAIYNDIAIQEIRQYFQDNPTATKLSRKDSRFKINGKQLKYSIIKGPNGKLYTLFSGQKNRKDPSFNPKNGLLGEGSYGSRVKLAQSLDDSTIIAVKIQPRSSTDVSDLKKEEELQTIVGQCIGTSKRKYAGKNSDYKGATKHYLYSEFFEGKSLKFFFAQNSEKLPIAEKLTIILEVLNKTKELHDAQIIHGDLSFNNILYHNDPNSTNKHQIAIIDFGLSGKANADGYISLANPMNNFYFAPECRNESSPIAYYKSDLYSLGQWIKRMKNNEPILNDLAEKMVNPVLGDRPNLDKIIQTVKDQLMTINNKPVEQANKVGLNESPTETPTKKTIKPL